jgi:hypothetical protein
VSALPFDGPHADAVAECIELASIEQLGRELARRCERALEAALAAKETCRTTDDLLVIATSAEAAYQASELCGHLSSAVCSLLGSADVETVKRCFAAAREASTHAALAAARWALMKKRAPVAHA